MLSFFRLHDELTWSLVQSFIYNHRVSSKRTRISSIGVCLCMIYYFMLMKGEKESTSWTLILYIHVIAQLTHVQLLLCCCFVYNCQLQKMKQCILWYLILINCNFWSVFARTKQLVELLCCGFFWRNVSYFKLTWPEIRVLVIFVNRVHFLAMLRVEFLQ